MRIREDHISAIKVMAGHAAAQNVSNWFSKLSIQKYQEFGLAFLNGGSNPGDPEKMVAAWGGLMDGLEIFLKLQGYSDKETHGIRSYLDGYDLSLAAEIQ